MDSRKAALMNKWSGANKVTPKNTFAHVQTSARTTVDHFVFPVKVEAGVCNIQCPL